MRSNIEVDLSEPSQYGKTRAEIRSVGSYINTKLHEAFRENVFHVTYHKNKVSNEWESKIKL